MFRKRQGRKVPVTRSSAYKDLLYAAAQFTTSEGFLTDSVPIEYSENAVIEAVTTEVAQGLFDQIDYYRSNEYFAHKRLGGDCGNIHLMVLEFMRKAYPHVPANLTLGEVTLSGCTRFPFNRERFLEWQQKRPKIFDCHAWVTIGTSHIIDATLGTYIATRINDSNCFGGVLYGSLEKLSVIPIANEPHRHPGGIPNSSANDRILLLRPTLRQHDTKGWLTSVWNDTSATKGEQDSFFTLFALLL